ncbi:MAG TPA: hypothetical protein VNA25_28145 [Phycisphaerae bacterium]|nr:hypothetical protein [Phycisphaerae bacterium]
MSGPGRLLAALALCMASHVSGCNGRASPQALRLLHEGKQALQNGELQVAVRKMDALLAEHARTRLAAEAYLVRGQARQQLADLDGAKADLGLAVALAADSAVRTRSLIALGDVAMRTADLGTADSAYRQALEGIETGQKPADHVLLQLGCVLQRQGRWAEADLQFDRLIYLFDGSPQAKLAGRKVRSRAWTIRTGQFDSRREAEKAAEGLRARKLDASTGEIQRQGRLAFVVEVGSFATYRQAAVAMGHVQPPLEKASIVETR